MEVDSKSYMGQKIDQKILGKHFSRATNEELKKNGTYDQWWIFQFRGPRQEFSKIHVV